MLATKFLLFYTFILFSCNFHSQNKDTIDVCSLLSDRPSVMAFKIPNEKCAPDNNNTGDIMKEINRNFEVNAIVTKVNSFSIDKYQFAEITYQNRICDTVAILFLIFENKNIIKTKAYKINNLDTDIRVYKKKGEVILYRKAKIKGKDVTVSFEFSKARHRLDDFIDDGLSIW